MYAGIELQDHFFKEWKKPGNAWFFLLNDADVLYEFEEAISSFCGA
jgi:hypothetical protein